MNDTNDRPYALTCDPPYYTETEMKIIRDELNKANEMIESLRSQFFAYKSNIQDKRWKAQTIALDIHRNVQAAEQLHFLIGNSATFMEGYNNARVAEVLHLLTQDNMLKLNSLQELHESQD